MYCRCGVIPAALGRLTPGLKVVLISKLWRTLGDNILQMPFASFSRLVFEWLAEYLTHCCDFFFNYFFLKASRGPTPPTSTLHFAESNMHGLSFPAGLWLSAFTVSFLPHYGLLCIKGVMAGLLKPTAFWFHSEEVPCQACKGISVCVKVILNKNNVSIKKKKKVLFLVHKQVSKAFCCKLGILGFLNISP